MTRPPFRRAARRALVPCLLALAAVATGLLTAAPGAADEASGTRAPLRVSMETLSTAVVPTSGRVTITGLVTNRSQETWTDLKAYMFTSAAPISSRSELDAAASTSGDAAVGDRVTAAGLYDVVGDLAPGQTRSYRVSVPRDSLGIGDQPGVYWIGVHVLGAEDGGIRDNVADGRVRTFIPLLPRHAAPTRLALVVPVKNAVRRGTAGRLLDIGAWQQSLSADGRLDRLLNLSGRATQAITWVVDPAVLDAAESVALDNPKIDIGPTPSAGSGSGSGASGSPGPSPGPSSPATSGSGNGSGDGSSDTGAAAEPSPQAVAARAWLDELRRQAPSHTLMAVPYGDLDVASVLESRQISLYHRATALSTATMTAQGLAGTSPVVDPVSGLLPGAALRRVDAGTPVLLRDAAYPDAAAPALDRTGRAPVVLADTGAGSGGPRPTSRYAALAVRQRILAAAAVHEMSSEHAQPLVVSTPPYWNPGAAWNDADFFAGLNQPWLQMVDLPSVVSGATPTPPGPPVYPRADRTAQVPLANLLASQRLVRTGGVFGQLLTANDTVENALSRIGMLASAQSVRDDPDRALSQVDSTTGYVRAQMQSVRIEGPDFVMMSGEEGPIQVTLVNGLDEPVRVGIASQTRSPGLTISQPDPVTLGPGRRTAIRLEARSNDIGVHAVTLAATDDRGNPIGTLTRFSVRTSRVSTLIWVIMAGGAALLFLAIGVRLYRRVRRRRSTHGPRLPRESRGLPGQEIDA